MSKSLQGLQVGHVQREAHLLLVCFCDKGATTIPRRRRPHHLVGLLLLVLVVAAGLSAFPCEAESSHKTAKTPAGSRLPRSQQQRQPELQQSQQQQQSQSSPSAQNETRNGCNSPTLAKSSSDLVDLDELSQQPGGAGANNSWPASLEARVSDYSTPTFYTLRLQADPTRQKFTGQLMIALDISEPEQSTQRPVAATSAQTGYRYLTLHAANNLRIRRAFYVFSSRPSLQIPATRVSRLPERELLAIDFHPNIISAGQGLLLIVYSGQVNETDSLGLFVHHSVRAKQQQQQNSSTTSQGAAGLATQMQPIFARRLLPAWDEPHLKARFSLIVVLPFRNYQCISNMAVKRKSISLSCSGEPLQEIEFHTTPLMSTYLLTLVVGHFDYIESVTANNCKVRAYFYSNGTGINSASDNHRRSEARYGLSVAVRAFERLEALLGVKYPLQKFDMIALREFKSGAMENWGAALFNENYLLHQQAQNSSGAAGDTVQLFGKTTRPRGLLIPLVIAHEIVHQWFGNLVTLRNWTYLWLNEGFAQLLMYEVAHGLFPELNYWHTFLEDSRQPAMHEDELLTSSHALEPSRSELQAELDAGNWSELFDKITYDKGAMVARMVWAILGREHFFAGLRHYLLKHSYGSVSSHDLWQALEESTGRPERQLESLMAGWLVHEGYPLVTCQLSAENATHFRLRLSQERFTLLGAERAPNGSSTSAGPDPLWSIAIGIASERQPAPEMPADLLLLLSDRSATLSLAKSQVGAWFKLNANATGYFRVDYVQPGGGDQAHAPNPLVRLAPAVRSQALAVIDRYNLVDDLFAMVRAGRKSSAYYLRYLIEAFGDEQEIIVLRAIVESLKRMRLAIVSNSNDGGKLSALFDRYVQAYLNQVSLTHQRQQQQQRSDANKAGKELEDLISVSRVVFNERAQIMRAASQIDASWFNEKVYTSASAGASQAEANQTRMDRELRASYYSALLIAADEPDLGADGALPAPASQQPSGATVNASSSLFLSLLGAYEWAESSAERWAICASLGTVEQTNKRLKLLNLALYGNYFRQTDVQPLFESMARSRLGRQLIWDALSSNAELLERRQLLPAALKSLQGGLVELVGAQRGQVERQMRSLYNTYGADYGKLIGQSIELLLVNSNWLQRDQAALLRFLESQPSS